MPRFARWTPAFALAVAVVAGGCVDKDKKPPKKQISEKYIADHLLAEAPQMENVVNASFGGGKILYLGNNVSVEKVGPGGKVTIDHYWKIVEPPGAQWKIFAHVAGSKKQDWMNVDYTDMREGYPASRWKAGDIIWDEQKFAFNSDWQSPYGDVLVGLYPKGKGGVQDRMEPDKKVGDAERRVKVARLQVDESLAVEPDTYVIRRAAGPITIDGKASEDSWRNAAESPDFTAVKGLRSDVQKTAARILYDDEYLYLFITAEDTDVYSEFKKHDDSMWQQDVFEIFIDADRSKNGYVELQVNPNNAHFDAWFPMTRAQKKTVQYGWSANMKTAIEVHGTLNEQGDTDTGWDAEIAIPLASVKGAAENMQVTLPPVPGDNWRLNIVRVDGIDAKKKSYRASSWNPITRGDFHALGLMLEVKFGDAEGKLPPPRPTPPEPVPGAPNDKPGAAKPGEGKAKPVGERSGPGATKPKPGVNPFKPSIEGAVKPGAAKKSSTPASKPAVDKK